MNTYVIIGTSHEIQDTSSVDDLMMQAAKKHSVELIAEEYPFKCASRVAGLAAKMGIRYLQVDPMPEDWTALDINREMEARGQLPPAEDIRLSHADAIREEFWLKKIEANLNRGRVLVICGYLHVKFLAQKVEERGGTVIEKSTFPAELLHRKPDMILDPAALEVYLKWLCEDSVTSEKGNPLGHTDETETR